MSTTARPLPSSHFPSVDALRGVCILLVLVLHFHLAFDLRHGAWAAVLPPFLLDHLVTNGNYGVVIFFVISGFLITSRSLARYGSLDRLNPREFYASRVGRILPNVGLMLALVLLFAGFGVRIFQNDAGGPSLGLTVLSVLTFTHNLLMQYYDYFNYCLNVLWSLSVEEVFYLTFPLATLLLRKPGRIALFLGLFVVTAPFYRYAHRLDDTDINGLYGYLACFDGIALGCLAALARRKWGPRLAAGRPLLLLGMAAVFFAGGIWTHVTAGSSAMSLLATLFVLGSGERVPRRWTLSATKPLRFLGRLSYELYLFHILILAWIKELVPRTGLAEGAKQALFAGFLLASVIAAHGIAHFFAEPLNRRIRRGLAGQRA